MGNLGAVFPVVHQEKVKVGDVVDDELEEAVGEQVPGLLVGPVADVGVGGKTLELAPEAAINTTGLPPRLLLPRGGGMGTGEVSASGGETEQEKKAQNPSFCRGWQSRGRRTARAVDERFRTRLMPRACVRCIRLRPATAQTLARKTRAARGCARIRSGSRPARLRCLPLCFAGISTHLDGDLAVALEPLELKGSLLDDFMLDEGSDLLRGGRDARRQRDGDGARRGFQILGLEPRTPSEGPIAGGKRTRRRPRTATREAGRDRCGTVERIVRGE